MGNHKLQVRLSKAELGALEIQTVREFIEEVIGGVSEVDAALGKELEKEWIERGLEFLIDPNLFSVSTVGRLMASTPDIREAILSFLEQRKEILIKAGKDGKKAIFFSLIRTALSVRWGMISLGFGVLK